MVSHSNPLMLSPMKLRGLLQGHNNPLGLRSNNTLLLGSENTPKCYFKLVNDKTQTKKGGSWKIQKKMEKWKSPKTYPSGVYRFFPILKNTFFGFFLLGQKREDFSNDLRVTTDKYSFQGLPPYEEYPVICFYLCNYKVFFQKGSFSEWLLCSGEELKRQLEFNDR